MVSPSAMLRGDGMNKFMQPRIDSLRSSVLTASV
jgi:hypothetical protein